MDSSKKKIISLIIVIVLVLCCIFGFKSCSKDTTSSSQKEVTETTTNNQDNDQTTDEEETQDEEVVTSDTTTITTTTSTKKSSSTSKKASVKKIVATASTTSSTTVTPTTTAVEKKDLSNFTVTGINASYTYTGSEIKVEPIVKDGNTTLVKGTDYTLSYKDNIKKGTATVIITGINNYTGSISKTFNIVKVNPYREKVLSINTNNKTLYEAGESNLTSSDVVSINGVDCYVLKVDTENNKAQLITKDIYATSYFDDVICASSTNEERYENTALTSFMNSFYSNSTTGQGLNSDEYIVDSYFTYYKAGGSSIGGCYEWVLSDKLFALDAKDAQDYASKFSWDATNTKSGFWVSATNIYQNNPTYGQSSLAGYCLSNAGTFENKVGNDSSIGARPTFWISLEDEAPTYTLNTFSTQFNGGTYARAYYASEGTIILTFTGGSGYRFTEFKVNDKDKMADVVDLDNGYKKATIHVDNADAISIWINYSPPAV